MAKSVLVTGSNSGIGLATAQHFGKAGFKVFASMRSPEKGEELAKEAADQGWDLQIIELDVASDASTRAGLEEVHGIVGALDVVVNNAGKGMQAAVEEASDEEILDLYNTNIIGMVRVLRYALPKMRARESGTIVNVSSMGGHVVFPYFGFYHSTKWALEALTESLYMELAPVGIRVYAVLPGLVSSNFGRAAVRSEKVADKSSAYRDDSKRWIGGFMELLPNSVGPETVAEKIVEIVQTEPQDLHHTSDEFAEQIVSARKQMSDLEWFDHFRGLHGLND
jgi:NAD(P)-dependent dehydrogenase (short-subunit alcohol dehydrogenase family)